MKLRTDMLRPSVLAGFCGGHLSRVSCVRKRAILENSC